MDERSVPQAKMFDSLETLLRDRDRLRTEHGKIIFVSGHFNVIHPGHLRLLKFAREQGGYLVIGVLSNVLAANVFVDELDRLEAVSLVAYVDGAFLITESPEAVIRELKPDVVIKGKEWALGGNSEEAAVKEYVGQLLF